MTDAVLDVRPLGFPWATTDPFLFCAYHDDAYPKGNGTWGPAASLAGRDIGQDFSRKDGWSMYHGESVPGFPAHPHRGFETVTIVRKGLCDHSDSLGAVARFGRGDVQWVTAGAGIVHSEMFPLLKTDEANPLELFQIWLNLPARRKMAQPHFTMLWADQIPRVTLRDAEGRASDVAVIAGRFGELAPLAPPPDSWAAQADADVAIWTLRQDAGARLTLPAAASAGTRRTLYFFKGASATVGGRAVQGPVLVSVRAEMPLEIVAGPGAECEWLLLQGRPIGEPVAQYGPFVMNTQQEIMQAMQDYRRTQFGGWPHGDAAPVHGGEPRRFARHPDGRQEAPG
ncbi:pirin family protein [Ramlibacter sp.]|uniref:pirin family protein n=1 Tax=Ramlibacter sp. TaxID=1917967 RepID=UPI0035B0CE59